MYVRRFVSLDAGAFLGKRVKIAEGRTTFICWGAWVGGEIEIGYGALIGPNVTIVSSHHGIEPGIDIKDQKTTHKPVKIGNNVWIGAGAVILGGNTIGNGAVIGAGSVLTEDNNVGENEIWVGNPCKFLKHR